MNITVTNELQHRYHLASCSLVADNSVHIWDLQRPFIPLASFTDHKDLATGTTYHYGFGAKPYTVVRPLVDSLMSFLLQILNGHTAPRAVRYCRAQRISSLLSIPSRLQSFHWYAESLHHHTTAQVLTLPPAPHRMTCPRVQ